MPTLCGVADKLLWDFREQKNILALGEPSDLETLSTLAKRHVDLDLWVLSQSPSLTVRISAIEPTLAARCRIVPIEAFDGMFAIAHLTGRIAFVVVSAHISYRITCARISLATRLLVRGGCLFVEAYDENRPRDIATRAVDDLVLTFEPKHLFERIDIGIENGLLLRKI